MKKSIFKGAATALITPANKEGAPDLAAYKKLIDWQIAEGIDALVSCGTTGESATLSEKEYEEVLAAGAEAAGGRVPFIAGTGSNDTAKAIAHTKKAAALGADAALVVTPYYNKATQKGLAAFFFAIADSSPIPLILYNVPSRTGVNIQPETYALMAEHPNIVGIKEASGNMSYAAKVAKYLSDDFAMYSGNDDMIVPLLSIGASGVISVLANIAPKETHQMVFDYLEGRTDDARRAQIELLDVINDLFIEVNPVPVKEAMNLLGMDVGGYRLPLTHMTEAHRETLRSSLAAAGFLK